MTILTSIKKKGGTAGKTEGDSGDHSGSHAIPHTLSIPHSQLPAENVTSGADRLFVPERSTTSTLSLWSHSQTLSHTLGHSLSLGTAREDIRSSQSSYDEYEHIDTGNTHGKRRRRASPMRSSRNKHSRVEREKSVASAASGSSAAVGGNSAVSEATSDICSLPEDASTEVNACNSEDEYEPQSTAQTSEEEWIERERRFEKKIRKKDLIIKKMGEDGACLFRAVADQVYGDQEMHSLVRKHCMDYIDKNGDYFSQYVTEDFNHYVNRKRLEYVHGNHIEIQAMSEMYNRTIEVFCYRTEPINTFHGTPQTDNAPIRLSYHRGVHYNSLVDPYKATIGVGLGLPGHHPGLADKNILQEAAIQSEKVHLEQAMLEDKLRVTDWEATNEAIEEQVARESYLQWLKDNERRNRAARSPTASSSSATVTSSSTSEIRSPRSRSHGGNISPIGSPFRSDSSYRNSPSRLSPPPSTPGTSKTTNSGSSPSHVPSSATVTSGNSEHAFQILETSSFINQLPPEMFGFNQWEDAGLLAQVLAASQQEYLDNLKRSLKSNSCDCVNEDKTSGEPEDPIESPSESGEQH